MSSQYLDWSVFKLHCCVSCYTTVKTLRQNEMHCNPANSVELARATTDRRDRSAESNCECSPLSQDTEVL